MAPSFDCVSSLLCAEDSNSVFDEGHSVYEDTWQHRRNHQRHVFGESYELPLQDDECFAMMVEKEQQHWPGVVYLNRLHSGDLDFGARNEAVDWIEKKGRAWTMQLLAVACLSLAAKMDESDVPMSVDLQVGDTKFVFEAKTIQRMELLILSTLRWRTQAITPFSFIDHFLCKINNDQSQLRSSIMKSIQLILSTARGIDFLEFKPSEIAAAVAMSVVGETKTIDTRQTIAVLIPQAEEERVLKCGKMVQELSLNTGIAKYHSSASVPCVPQSPIGVLDALSFSYKSDDTNAGSCANSSHNDNSPDAKRRKLNKTCGSELL
ncbi:PREDICTED: cyclin-D4-2-like isoform X2 [Lupinus angustifolius]|uniref:cyclin-D4-2-like isoform X2 n=1 Tax=Lupinus angustifolius TaxID=3871 RepID=UPI00092E1F75|nr:PREDICTED: cyclin-D4-2-like isoform X2 [Lupinus angustifolius]